MDFQAVVRGRRSIRFYHPTPINEALLLRLLEDASFAPSGINLQPWFFLALQSDAEKQKLYDILQQVIPAFQPTLQTRFARNPHVIGETNAFLKRLADAPVIVLVFALKPDYEDPNSIYQAIGAAIQNFCLSAYDAGLGTCWVTAPLTAGFGPIIHDAFAPDKGPLMALITLGDPAQDSKAPPRREGRFELR